MVEISAWIRSIRDNGRIAFIDIQDGSFAEALQVVAESSKLPRDCHNGAAVLVRGTLVKSPARGQNVELKAEQIFLLGNCPQENYPLQKKQHSLDFLRSIPHLRIRTNTFLAVARIRSFLAQAIHRFFEREQYYHIHTPIITSSDTEGTGELFSVHHKKGTSFFGTPSYLTVSGQLAAETHALALGKVYTFGPTFRAENSNTNRHLSEFWMIEAEAAFLDIGGLIELSTSMLYYVLYELYKECIEDIRLLSTLHTPGLIEQIEHLLTTSYVRISYTEAIDVLKSAKRNFTFSPQWGMDIQTEHEKFLCEIHYKAPVVIYDYPRAEKAFYMRVNDDQKTVAAMDIILPYFGEIVGGSQREERYDVLLCSMKEQGINPSHYTSYLDLRRFGSVIHAGFGLGFERLVQCATGMRNIRDVIPFPRAPGLIPD